MVNQHIANWYGLDIRDQERTQLEITRSDFLNIVDPLCSTQCFFCGRGKPEGVLSCQDCSDMCPDPHCKGTRTKNRDEDMCDHCQRFLYRLDAPWIGEGNERKDGYFIYELDNGYIGMTYNPTQRQFAHEKSHWLENYMTENGIVATDARRAYRNRSMINFNNGEWLQRYEEWRREMLNDRKIRWLSPVVSTRWEVYRCEWALKQLRDSGNKTLVAQYENATSVSSVPIIVWEGGELHYDAVGKHIIFDLRWKTSYGLYPDQIVQPA